MASTAPSTDDLILYILLPIILFMFLVLVVYYCYRRRKWCFSTKDEALLGNVEKKRFTVDLGKRRRRTSSLTSTTGDSFEYYYPGNSQENYQSNSGSNNNYFFNTSEKTSTSGSTIIATSTAVPRPDIRKTVVVGQAVNRDNTLSVGHYHRRATSPAQSLPEYPSVKSAPDIGSSEFYSRHHSYDSAVSGRRISENVVYNTISENDVPTSYVPNITSSMSSQGIGGSSHPAPPSPRRLRHQARVKGKENEPSFSRPTKPARVSLVISAVESLDFASSSEDSGSDSERVETVKRRQIYSPYTPELKHKKNSKGELQPRRTRTKSSSSAGDPSNQYSGRSSPAILTSVVQREDMSLPPRSPRSRSRSSPVGPGQTSLDVEALQAALSQHRRSDGDILGNGHRYKIQDDVDGPFRSGELGKSANKMEKTSQQSLGGRRSGVDTLSPNSSTNSLGMTKDPLIPAASRQRRRSSMQMPIDLRQINPKLYEDMIRLPSMDSEEPDDETPQIHFSLDYNREMEILTVKLIQARNLQTQAFSGTCDPYCTVAILPGFNARQSKVHRRNTDPEFEEKFVFGVKQSDLKMKTLEIRTFDFDQFSRDECSGVMAMKLDVLDFDMTQSYDLWKKFRLQDLKSSTSTEICGDLLLALSYLPSAEKLTVAIQKARNLKSAESRKGPPDPYIKVCIYRGNQRLKKKKTDSMHGTCNPVFNQALTFSISPELMQSPLIRITCQAVHDQKLSYNEELGFIQIGPSSEGKEELNHWRDVSGKHSNKPVARWHRLQPPTGVTFNNSNGQSQNPLSFRRSSSTALPGKTDERRSPADSDH